jgi:tetratricopeptide (TPR) repeat protein
MLKRIVVAIVSSNLVIFLALAVFGFVVFNKPEIDLVYLNQSKDDIETVFNFSLGEAKFDRKKMKRVLVYNQMLADYLPRPVLAYANQGYCYFYLGEMDKAIESYNKAIAQLPDMYMFYYDLGTIYLAKKDYQLAYKNYSKSMDLIVIGQEQFFALVKVVKKQRSQLSGYYDDSTVMLARFDYDKRRNFYQLIKAAEGMNELADMRNAAYQGMLVFPDDARFCFLAGKANLMLKDQEQALSLFNQAIKRQPDYQEALFFRGLIYKERGLGREAFLDLQKAQTASAREMPVAIEENLDLHLYYDRGLFFVMISLQ